MPESKFPDGYQIPEVQPASGETDITPTETEINITPQPGGFSPDYHEVPLSPYDWYNCPKHGQGRGKRCPWAPPHR